MSDKKFIELRNVSKQFKSKILFENVNMTFEEGYIYGLCGYNGCGKTMLLRILAGLVRTSSGEVLYNNQSLQRNKMQDIGIMIDKAGFFEEMTAFDNLSLLASLKNIIKKKDILQYLEYVGLDNVPNMPVKKYSLGMKQRLAFAQAIMENPDILLLDEPTNALDDKGVKMVHDMIQGLKKEGKIIIMTSHSVFDIERLCDVVCEFKEGKIIRNEKI